jgi:hypothetical protein
MSDDYMKPPKLDPKMYAADDAIAWRKLPTINGMPLIFLEDEITYETFMKEACDHWAKLNEEALDKDKPDSGG